MASPVPILLTVRELSIGGCERDLAKTALGLDRRLFTPHVGCFSATGLRAAELRDAGVPIVDFRVRSFLNASLLSGMASFRRYVRTHGIRLVHAFDVPTTLFAVPAAAVARVPVRIGSQLAYRADLFSPNDIRLLRLTDRLADAVVVNSWAVRRHLIADHGTDPKRIYVSWNGVDPAVFHPGPGELPRTSLVAGTVAALREEKRIDMFLRAFAKATERHPDVRALIVGSGVELPKLEQTARDCGITSRVTFVPARPEVAGLMRSMDIFVQCSRSESFPNALLEAMACGCAPIGTDVGGIPELVENGRSGFVVPSGDETALAGALQTYIEDAEVRERMAQAAAERALREFHMGLAIERLQRLYTSLLRGDGIPSQSPGTAAAA